MTIVDTPSYSDIEDPVKNQEITNLISNYFSDGNGLQEVDMVGFVMDSSEPDLMGLQVKIYCSLITLFGNNIKTDVNFLLNHSDDEEPPLLSSITEAGLLTGQHHKFNSLAVFHSDAKDFTLCMENFNNFLTLLSMTATKTISLPFWKKQMTLAVYGLQDRMNIYIIEYQSLRKSRDKFKLLLQKEEEEFEEDVVVAKKKGLPLGNYVTNCTKCQITCHRLCGLKKEKFACDVMDHSMPEESRTCRVCPDKCSWDLHASVKPFKWICVKEPQSSTFYAIKKKYETEYVISAFAKRHR